MKGGRPMSVSVEIFVGVQAVSGFCLLVALSHPMDGWGFAPLEPPV